MKRSHSIIPTGIWTLEWMLEPLQLDIGILLSKILLRHHDNGTHIVATTRQCHDNEKTDIIPQKPVIDHKIYFLYSLLDWICSFVMIRAHDCLHFCTNNDYYRNFFIIIMQPLNMRINYMKFWAEMGRNDIVVIVTTILSILLRQYCRGSQCCCCDNVATILCLVARILDTSYGTFFNIYIDNKTRHRRF